MSVDRLQVIRMGRRETAWRPIVGFSKYEVSTEGQVRRIARGNGTQVGRSLKSFPASDGYVSVSLYKDGKCRQMPVHRAVLFAFVGPPPRDGKWQGAHGDGNKSHNTLENLRWATPQENADDKIAHGTVAFGERCNRKLSNSDVATIKTLKGQKTGAEVAKIFGVSDTHIYYIWNNKSRQRG